ncbi:recombination mediator RecR [Carboxydothermus hydrogenoformans]|uniref:Recombination protein RecR n=1 Tax=Carboxydothermus hydrogenoformans (strain ATCC BAA-161 / DSM 6008 / Z-2901) TaxID=246194 RepID=RECR_CARHZ|nr:recombination mediator RecR [Carboxydothermus hydrogenoformans]Q3A8S2.1 RecName: Full=Recombination protein RecR [Carboxydothermus hydrogenoformans Z-2901]ABB13781.1 recombination protein RecR [Carboxydothermus hydrogenoformans Z-2901]
MYFAEPVAKLIEHLAKLPGIGPKTAQKLALYLLEIPEEEARALAEAIITARKNTRYCSICFNLTDTDPCAICRNPGRNHRLLMVVEEAKDVAAMERTGSFNGIYHVLHGVLSPIKGIGPEDLKVRELLLRLSREPVEEIIIATNPTVEGEATAMYLASLLKPLNFKVTRIAHGLPVGSDIEYADELTIRKALEGRRVLE